MNRLIAFIACVFVIVLVVSVWRHLQPETQKAIVMACSGLVQLIARLVDEAVAALVGS